ncbi:hypothetical protein KGM_210866 [Danaus plexippus plexippus]|uniref:Uncharacterized protein n=1 Tax=Danaus plexippus plexippus TaxID=278856 RepID=A0A212F2J3_DANPL|nr:hypothetical protein KGM_210866 [Danaus plexippus plexippus]
MNYLMFPLLAAMVSARYQQELLRPFKTLPGNSLVNLGKIDISFYINPRHQDVPTKSEEFSHGPLLSTVEGPCPCSNFKMVKDTVKKPSDILGKILSGNDLFKYKEPMSSMFCCDSHENVREEIILEFGPKKTQTVENAHNSFPLLPFIFDSFQRPKLPLMSPKTSAVEILFYPKNSVVSNDFDNVFAQRNIKKLNPVKKDTIKIVGDKEIKNDIKSGQFIPPIPSSVKKDLTGQFSTIGIKEETTNPNNKSNNI